MFKTKREITICVDKEYTIDIQHFIDNHIKTIGIETVYAEDDKHYIGFNTYLTADKVAKILCEKLYKAKTDIVGGTIFVKFYLR